MSLRARQGEDCLGNPARWDGAPRRAHAEGLLIEYSERPAPPGELHRTLQAD